MVNYNPEFSEGQVNKLLNLINSYRMCFVFSAQELGCTNVVEMDIVDSGVTVVCKPYRTSAAERKTIAGIVKEWKEAGIVSDPYHLMLSRCSWYKKRMVIPDWWWTTESLMLRRCEGVPYTTAR